MGAFPPHDEEIHFLWRSSSTTLSFQRCLLCEILFRWIVARGWNRQCNHPLQYRTANKVNVSGSYHGVRRRNNTTRFRLASYWVANKKDGPPITLVASL